MNQRISFGRFSREQHEIKITSEETFFGELAAKPAWLVGFVFLNSLDLADGDLSNHELEGQEARFLRVMFMGQ